MKKYILLLVFAVMIACTKNEEKSDAFGNFEANEIILSAEVNGTVNYSNIEEGRDYKRNELLAIIDTTQLVLKRDQLFASMKTVDSKTQNVIVQIDVLEKRKQNLQREIARFEKLLREGAATSKQIDDMKGELDVVDKQIIATKTQLSNLNSGILSEKNPLMVQVQQLNDMISKSYVKAPMDCTVLTEYLKANEYAIPGKPICKLADMKTMILRVYIGGNQLSKVKVGNMVKVLIDKDSKTYETFEGKISWIADKAEFTPKIIQTKEERVNQVYAMKVTVKNDGRLKIGMPGEVKF